MSLILSNVPMSPKFINGSFAALFDTNEIIVEYARELGRNSIDFNGRPIRLCPRRKLREQSKQYSFDMSQMSTYRRINPASFKQGSLDSKIEEIFDGSFDSDSVYDTDTEGVANGEESSTPQVSEGTEDKPKGNGKVLVNGMHAPLVCKHCGQAMTPP